MSSQALQQQLETSSAVRQQQIKTVTTFFPSRAQRAMKTARRSRAGADGHSHTLRSGTGQSLHTRGPSAAKIRGREHDQRRVADRDSHRRHRHHCRGTPLIRKWSAGAVRCSLLLAIPRRPDRLSGLDGRTVCPSTTGGMRRSIPCDGDAVLGSPARNTPGTDSDVASIQQELYSPREHGIAAEQMGRYLRQHGFQVFALNGSWSDLEEQLRKGAH